MAIAYCEERDILQNVKAIYSAYEDGTLTSGGGLIVIPEGETVDPTNRTTTSMYLQITGTELNTPIPPNTHISVSPSISMVIEN